MDIATANKLVEHKIDTIEAFVTKGYKGSFIGMVDKLEIRPGSLLCMLSEAKKVIPNFNIDSLETEKD